MRGIHKAASKHLTLKLFYIIHKIETIANDSRNVQRRPTYVQEYAEVQCQLLVLHGKNDKNTVHTLERIWSCVVLKVHESQFEPRKEKHCELVL